MKSENIDDLFRQQLDGHATPPPPDLWARLSLPAAPAPEAAPLDELFRAGLAAHATSPRRELWERLEDEHLRPRPQRRRVVAWWQYSAAAVLLLMLLAGGAGLWRGGHFGPATSGLATTKAGRSQKQQREQPAAGSSGVTKDLTSKKAEVTIPSTNRSDNTLASTAATVLERNQQNISAQATAPRSSTSSTPLATTTRPRRAAAADRAGSSHHLLQQGRQPDAAAGQLATTGRRTPAGQPQPTPQVAPTPTEVPATRTTTPTLAVARPTPAETTSETIEVEVRRGGMPTPAAPVVIAKTTAAPDPTRRPRRRLGGLLRQADHLVHGEPVSLAEATGLPETVTLQAHLGGRLLSRTIQL